MKKRAIFIAATGQNVGKSTLCLGLLSALKKRFGEIGFMKPVGQQHAMVDGGLLVDKDVVLFKEQFGLPFDYKDMSPLMVPHGFTRKYLRGEVDRNEVIEQIKVAFEHIAAQVPFTLVEGTGHVGVGSIIDLNNAQVAALLGLDVIIIVSGGLGSATDELALNVAMCHRFGVRVRGVILNRVLDSKREMILEYFPSALKQWDLPLIGCVPYNEFLGTPSMKDFATLFGTQLLSGERHGFRHFHHTRLVAGSKESYQDELFPNQLIITPASREDIIEETLKTHRRVREEKGVDYEGGMILTGRRLPREEIIEEMRAEDIPALYAPCDSYTAMKKITSFTAKTAKDDFGKVRQAIDLVEEFVDLNRLCDMVSH